MAVNLLRSLRNPWLLFFFRYLYFLLLLYFFFFSFLPCRELQHLYDQIEPELQKIFKGEVKCVRREEYLRGGRARSNLKAAVGFGTLSDSEVSHLSTLLIATFCAGGGKMRYYSFVMDVLLAEAITRIMAAREGVSLEEAERLLLHPKAASGGRPKSDHSLAKEKPVHKQGEGKKEKERGGRE